ncbi:hypothetical protein OIY81_1552 [Cryptosporidium canis]|uniref:Uncharacterized protein n=1 Tax=Cryptosporidium canis TaxID=195482 RepID=A0ABQ8P925_9CRYT|nr:hypothetical protein OIY81_1552 [Cryptosporidium canis]KAJ1612888.1 hypothetical protein OJ252_1098 [Cryptosporidium canis]
MDGAVPDQQLVEEELVFVDLPELSRFEIFEGMKVRIENISFKEADEEMGFNLVVEPLENPEKESMTFKFQGKNMETVGTCLFFADADSESSDKGQSGGECSRDSAAERNKDDPMGVEDVEMADCSETQSVPETGKPKESQDGGPDIVSSISKSKLVCVGKCKKVIQAFIEEQS